MALVKEVKKADGITYDEVMQRFYKLSNVRGLNASQEKVSYARSRNLLTHRKFEKENCEDSRIPTSDEIVSYQREYQALRSKYLLTDKEGKAVMQQVQTKNGIEIVPTVDIANPELIKGMEDLKTKYAEAIKEREDDLKAYEDFKNEIVPEADMPHVHEVKKADAPGLDQEQIDGCYWFIKDEKEPGK